MYNTVAMSNARRTYQSAINFQLIKRLANKACLILSFSS